MPTFKKLSAYILSMVRVKSTVTEEGIAAIMIDGYAPSPREFEALPWAEMWREEGLNYWEWLNRIRPHQRNIKKHYSESAYLTAYRNAVRAVMRGFCPSRKETFDPSLMRLSYPEPVCYYQGFTTGCTSGSIEIPAQRAVISRALWKTQLPELQREYRHDEQNKRVHYIQNIIMWPDCPESRCSRIEECQTQWIETLRFQEKPSDDYVDLDNFIHTWSNLLADMTQVKPGRWFRFYDELGLGCVDY